MESFSWADIVEEEEAIASTSPAITSTSPFVPIKSSLIDKSKTFSSLFTKAATETETETENESEDEAETNYEIVDIIPEYEIPADDIDITDNKFDDPYIPDISFDDVKKPKDIKKSEFSHSIEEATNFYNYIMKSLYNAPGSQFNIIKLVENYRKKFINILKETDPKLIEGIISYLKVLKLNLYDHITPDRKYKYTVIDIDVRWINKEYMGLLQDIAQTAGVGLIIENRIDKFKSFIIIKTDQRLLRMLKINYNNTKKLPF